MLPSHTGILFSLWLLVISCTFTLDEPTGITKEITPITPKGTISLTEYVGVDTIYLFSNKTFTFDIRNDLSGLSFAGEAYFDNNVFYTFTDRQGQFNIPDSYFKTGTHKLRLSFKQPLNDGSLISQFKEKEGSIFKEWVVIIDIDPPPSFEIKTSIENGFVTYTWPEYTKADFNHYELNVNTGSRYKKVLVDDRTKTSFTDLTYIDGMDGSSIRVTIHTDHGLVESQASVNEPPIKFDMVFNTADTTASFTWSKPKYRGAFKSYTISDERLGSLANITNVTDTTLKLKITGVFPGTTLIRFKMLDKLGTEIFSVERSINFFLGHEIPEPSYAQFWYYSKTANKFIGRAGGKINIYDGKFHLLDSRTIENNMFYGMTLAWPGSFLHYGGSGNKISQLNLLTNVETSMTIPGDYMPAAYLSVISGSENQIVSFGAIDNDHVHPAKDFVGLVDMQAGTILQQTASGAWTSICDDGRYSFGWPNVYSVTGGTQTEIGPIPNNYYYRWFRGDNTDEIVTTHYASNLVTEIKTVILRSSDLQTLRTIDPPEAGFSLTSYDPATKTLLYTRHGANIVYLVNIETGNKKVFHAAGSYNTPLVNGNIIIGGRYIKVL